MSKAQGNDARKNRLLGALGEWQPQADRPPSSAHQAQAWCHRLRGRRPPQARLFPTGHRPLTANRETQTSIAHCATNRDRENRSCSFRLMAVGMRNCDEAALSVAVPRSPMAPVGASAEYAPLPGSRRSPTSPLACTSVGLSSSRWLATDDLGIGSAKILLTRRRLGQPSGSAAPSIFVGQHDRNDASGNGRIRRIRRVVRQSLVVVVDLGKDHVAFGLERPEVMFFVRVVGVTKIVKQRGF
jgi:hypothetical protein